MKPSEFRQYSEEELVAKRNSLYRELFNLRTQLVTGQLGNLNKIKEMKIILGSGEWDSNLEENKRMSEILNQKNIPHQLDFKPNTGGDWGWWREIFPEYIKNIINQ